MEQKYTSRHTSINSTKLPASTKYIPWEKYKGKNVLDYGGGKFDNLKDYLKDNYDINLYIYDKYNRPLPDNEIAMANTYDLIICNNVLNIIMEDELVQEAVNNIRQRLNKDGVACFYIYECDKSGIGKETKNDCWQRNELTKDYIRFMECFGNISIKHKIIFCRCV